MIFGCYFSHLKRFSRALFSFKNTLWILESKTKRVWILKSKTFLYIKRRQYFPISTVLCLNIMFENCVVSCRFLLKNLFYTITNACLYQILTICMSQQKKTSFCLCAGTVHIIIRKMHFYSKFCHF